MEPVVAVQTLLLRAQLPELPLRPGASVVARVLSRGDAQGVLVIAGIPLTAQLPEAVGATGDTLRLRVQEVTPERVTLHLDQVIPGGPLPPAHAEARARVRVQDPPRRTTVGGEERAGVALSFESPALGRLDLRVDVAAGRVSVAVEAPAGRAFSLAEAGAGRLGDGLHARTGLQPDVRVTPRRDPLDVYA